VPGANYLELELTESVLMQDATVTNPVLNMLKGLGGKLAIDDFSTGYSSLSYLRQFPVDTLRIDKYSSAEWRAAQRMPRLSVR
jgi:EAL domain-containing protein (putative c-di-GMP-specific phosphodiesterase class I)